MKVLKDLNFLKSKLIAHRGIYDNEKVFENSLSAILKAVSLGYIVEIDVRMLKDGEIVVFHDKDMMRLLNVEGCIEDLTYDELSYIAKYEVPKLKDILEFVKGEVPLLIELKTITKRGLFESKVAEILDNYNGEFAIQSFNIKTIKWFSKNRENYIIGYLIGKSNYKKEYFFKKYDFINCDINLYSDNKIKRLRTDKLVIGYTVDTKEVLESKRFLYDNLTCNNLLEIDDVK